MKADSINGISDWVGSEGVSAASYNAAAARARKLHADATTPRLKKYLQEFIAKCERLARKVQAELNDASQIPGGSNQKGGRSG
jgi:hypothetical protein